MMFLLTFHHELRDLDGQIRDSAIQIIRDGATFARPRFPSRFAPAIRHLDTCHVTLYVITLYVKANRSPLDSGAHAQSYPRVDMNHLRRMNDFEEAGPSLTELSLSGHTVNHLNIALDVLGGCFRMIWWTSHTAIVRNLSTYRYSLSQWIWRH